MSTKTCPYCKAAEDPNWRCENVAWFMCGTMITQNKPSRTDQTNTCVENEVAGLTNQRDQLLQKVQRLEEAVEILVAFGNQLGDELYPPDRNCSCHILSPCQDCEQWDSQRVAKSDWANAVERANKAKETKP